MFYLLYNHALVPPERLIWALYYQYVGSWDQTPDFTQILLAFDDRLRSPLMALRESLGELDEEPLGHLLVDTGRISPGQLQLARNLKKAFPGVYLGKILIVQGVLDVDQLERAMLYPYFAASPQPGEKLLVQIERRLWQGGHFSRADAERFELPARDSLPAHLAPLADLLVLNGELPLHLAARAREPSLDQDPIWAIVADMGIGPAQLPTRLLPPTDYRSVALELVQAGLIERRRLSNLILHRMSALLPPVRILGAAEARPGIPERARTRQLLQPFSRQDV